MLIPVCLQWKTLPEDEKRIYEQLAKEDRLRYDRECSVRFFDVNLYILCKSSDFSNLINTDKRRGSFDDAGGASQGERCDWDWVQNERYNGKFRIYFISTFEGKSWIEHSNKTRYHSSHQIHNSDASNFKEANKRTREISDKEREKHQAKRQVIFQFFSCPCVRKIANVMC